MVREIESMCGGEGEGEREREDGYELTPLKHKRLQYVSHNILHTDNFDV